MTVKQYLMQGQTMNRRIDRFLSRADRLCRRLMLPGEQEEDRIRLANTHMELKQELINLSRWQKETNVLISTLTDRNHRMVLTLRYVCGLRWEQVAQRMHYSSRHLHRLHLQAMEALAACYGPGGQAA